MKKPSRAKIRQAVLANRGGLEQATDAQIWAIWASLDVATQERYLASVKTGKGGSDASGDES